MDKGQCNAGNKKGQTIQKSYNTGQTINPGQCKFRIKKVKAKIKVRKKSQNDQATKRSGSMDKKYVNGIEILKWAHGKITPKLTTRT